ncbi:hypothetical protein DM558_06400 [Entomomonas moraniae]|uniref:Uncharacterized protein n=1 Tax=Entomomonas moraniae TaxID=2213226 RepID=A0A3Q9JLK3_9GAMM|nr:hypothetical protein [Entomomonas moraniae]AZS50428.1 hypothetical protein DM558_06400 [Entomomonas moraniae]
MITEQEWDYIKEGDSIYWAHPFVNKVREMKITAIRQTGFDSILIDTGVSDKNTRKAFSFLFSDPDCARKFLDEHIKLIEESNKRG